MKKYILLFVAILFIGSANAQVDRTKAPQAGPAPKVQMGDFNSFTLKNGLKILLVENHKIPKVSFNLSLDIDPIFQGDKCGYVDIAGDLISKGSKTKTKAQINEQVDFMGANLSSYSEGVAISGLSRYKKDLFSIMADVVLNPVFPKEEFDMIVGEMEASIKHNMSSSAHIAQTIRSKVLYGEKHPYGENLTSTSLKNIKLEDCKNYYNTFFKPNVAILTIVGDITLKEVKKLAKSHFNKWKKANVPTFTYELAKAPVGRRVIFSNKDAAPQSSIRIVNLIDLKPGDKDVIPSKVMNSMLGSGFSGLLFKNLREDKAYTYGAYSTINSDKIAARFYTTSDVKANVTDSAFVEMRKEMNVMRNTLLTQDHLNMTKAAMAGDFARALEKSTTIASFARSIIVNNLDKDYYVNYLENLSKVTLEDVKLMANKYIDPENALYIVVGDKSYKERLRKLSSTNTIEEYDFEANIVKENANAIDASITAETVIDAYLNAIGGRSNLSAVKNISFKGNMKMGPMNIDVTMDQKGNEKFLLEMKMGQQILQKITYNGKIAKMTAQGQVKEFKGDDAKKFANQAIIFAELSDSYKAEIDGADKLNGEKVYKLKVVDNDGTRYDFYSVKTGLKLKTLKQENGMSQLIIYSDYRQVDGIKFPFSVVTSVGPQEMPMIFNEILINKSIDDSIFN